MSTPPRRSLFARLLPPRPGTHNHNGRRPGEFVRTLPVVVFLTVLIWIYAEQAQTREETLTMQFDLQATDPTLDVSLSGASDDKVSVSISGPRGQIEQLRNQIEAAPLNGRIRVPLSAAESAAGEKNIDLVSRLKDMPLFSNSAITVTKTSPAQVRAVVDPVVSRDVTVVLPSDLPVTLQNFTFSPAKITVRGPSIAINREFAGDNPTITVDASPLRNNVSAGEQQRELTVQPSRDDHIALSQTKVRMTFEVASTITEGRIPTVPILVERPLGDEGKYKVVMRRGLVINNVKIRGPANVVAKYTGDQPEQSLKAVLAVSQADVGSVDRARQVTFPYKEAGVTIENEPIEVTFDVVDLTP